MKDKYDDKLERAYMLAKEEGTGEYTLALLRELIDRVQALESKPSQKRFKPPTVQDVFAYMVTKKMMHPLPAHDESQKFIDFYESKNWYVGKNKMKSWESACNNWIRRANDENTKRANGSRVYETPGERIARETETNVFAEDVRQSVEGIEVIEADHSGRV